MTQDAQPGGMLRVTWPYALTLAFVLLPVVIARACSTYVVALHVPLPTAESRLREACLQELSPGAQAL